MPEFPPLEGDLVQGEPELPTHTCAKQVTATLTSKLVCRHSPRHRRPHSKPPAKAKLLLEANCFSAPKRLCRCFQLASAV